jgi:hypothetical protein
MSARPKSFDEPAVPPSPAAPLHETDAADAAFEALRARSCAAVPSVSPPPLDDTRFEALLTALRALGSGGGAPTAAGRSQDPAGGEGGVPLGSGSPVGQTLLKAFEEAATSLDEWCRRLNAQLPAADKIWRQAHAELARLAVNLKLRLRRDDPDALLVVELAGLRLALPAAAVEAVAPLEEEEPPPGPAMIALPAVAGAAPLHRVRLRAGGWLAADTLHGVQAGTRLSAPALGIVLVRGEDGRLAVLIGHAPETVSFHPTV